MFDRKVKKDKEAYLITYLLEDIKSMCIEKRLQEPFMKYTYEFKGKLQGRFGDHISF